MDLNDDLYERASLLDEDDYREGVLLLRREGGGCDQRYFTYEIERL